MNLAVNAILKALSDAATTFRAEALKSGLEIDSETERYLQALDLLPVDTCRSSVFACRSSGLRREAIRQLIIDGNATGRFRSPSGLAYVVPLLELLRDMPTRWSSTYNMIKRYLELYPVRLLWFSNSLLIPLHSGSR